ncbi:MAG: hypothetical protein ACRCTZ_16065 [Sarcina sp.]
MIISKKYKEVLNHCIATDIDITKGMDIDTEFTKEDKIKELEFLDSILNKINNNNFDFTEKEIMQFKSATISEVEYYDYKNIPINLQKGYFHLYRKLN